MWVRVGCQANRLAVGKLGDAAPVPLRRPAVRTPDALRRDARPREALGPGAAQPVVPRLGPAGEPADDRGDDDGEDDEPGPRLARHRGAGAPRPASTSSSIRTS